MNFRTSLVTFVIVVFACGILFASIIGVFAIPTVNSNYIRQSAADRIIQGGGSGFGK